MARWDRYDDYWPRYVPVAERRAKAEKELANRAKKGQASSPILIEGRTIASSFWGKAWCDNLERYSDFANRIPRGRTYVRNGSVVDLQISAGSVQALVSGSELYDVQIRIAAVPTAHWTSVRRDCSGAIDSLVELLQGRFSKAVMARMCERDKGLFPSPKEIEFDCSCPDNADMCKHIAAVLYGVGARLDKSPELLFVLRSVDHLELISQAGNNISDKAAAASNKVLIADDLSSIFGIELEASAPAPSYSSKVPKRRNVKVKKTGRSGKETAAKSRTGSGSAASQKPSTRKIPKKISRLKGKRGTQP